MNIARVLNKLCREKVNIKNRLGFIASSLSRKKILLIGLPMSLLSVLIVFVVLVRFKVIPDPFPLQNIPFLQMGPKVAIKSEYKNPFSKSTQYVNPFDTYKNPFVVNR